MITKKNIQENDKVLIIGNSTEGIGYNLRPQLRKIGYETIITSDGYDGIKVFQLDPSKFRMIIIDMSIKNISGIDLARLILDLNLNPHTSIIIHSQIGDMIIKRSKKGVRVKKLPEYLLAA